MRKNQLYYLIYPIIYFIIATVGQYFTSGNIRWRENLSLTVIAIVIVFLAFVIFNWANLPHASKSKSKWNNLPLTLKYIINWGLRSDTGFICFFNMGYTDYPSYKCIF